MSWYVDEGLAQLRREVRQVYPNAVIYTIGDTKHSINPDVTQHAPDRGGSKPGDDKGEVDALDIMAGSKPGQPNMDDLWDIFHGLHDYRDKRILYVICGDKIYSSVTKPWSIRKYNGKYHSHLHISVNDNYDNNQSDWSWEKLVAREIEYVDVVGAKLPLLQLGDDDSARDGWNHVCRVQTLANWMHPKSDALDVDGVYGPKTAQKFRYIFAGSNGKSLSLPQIKRLYGIS